MVFLALSAAATETAKPTVQESPGVAAAVVFFDDVENGINGWEYALPWDRTTSSSFSPTHSWTDSPAGNYAANANTVLISPILDFSGRTGVYLKFRNRHFTEADYDFCQVEYAWNSFVWFTVASYTGVQATWRETLIAIPGLDGANEGRILFRLDSDLAIEDDGCYVDDITLGFGLVFFDGFETGDGCAWTDSAGATDLCPPPSGRGGSPGSPVIASIAP